MHKFFKIILLLVIVGCSTTQIEQNDVVKNKFTKSQDIQDAENYYHIAEYAKAAEAFKNIQDADKYSQETLFIYAESLRLSNDVNEAIEIYDKIININSDYLQAIEGKALCFVSQGDFSAAAVLLNKVLAADATKWRTINALGVIYALKGELAEAVEYYELAMQVSENNPVIANNLGLSLAFSGLHDEGKKVIEESLSNVLQHETEKFKKIEYNLALIYGMAGDMDTSADILRKYLAESEILNNLGFYAKLSKDKELAKSYLSEALAKSPVHYEKAWNNLNDLAM
jgi:Flp pilus assembly protein TadD